jgi:hypothetical protein
VVVEQMEELLKVIICRRESVSPVKDVLLLLRRGTRLDCVIFQEQFHHPLVSEMDKRIWFVSRVGGSSNINESVW